VIHASFWQRPEPSCHFPSACFITSPERYHNQALSMAAQNVPDPSEGLGGQNPFQSTASQSNLATMMDKERKSEPSESPNQKNSLRATVFNLSLPIRTVSENFPQELAPPPGRSDTLEEDPESGSRKVTTLVSRYSTLHLGSKSWTCQTCNQKAAELIHLTSSKRPELGDIGSAVSDLLIPVCTSHACVTQGNALVESLWICGAPDSETTSCESCGNKSRMKLCAGCRLTRK